MSESRPPTPDERDESFARGPLTLSEGQDLPRLSPAVACAKCQDKGAYVMVTREERGSLKSVTSSTIPCECRKALPPREGQASWWGLESIYSQDVRIPVGDESFEVSVSAEVPYDSANYRVQRRGNRYYPTLIDIECPDFMTLHACTARDLARALLAAAEAAEKIDDSDTDPRCGHWAPCECSESSQSVGAVARPDGITTG